MKALSKSLLLSIALISTEALATKPLEASGEFVTGRLIKLTKLPCNISSQSKDYVACASGEVFSLDKLVLKAKSEVKFIDNYKDKVLVLSYKNGRSFIEVFDNLGHSLCGFDVALSTMAAYLSDDAIVLIDLSNTIKIIDYKQHIRFVKSFSSASASASAINKNHDKLALGDEGGALRLVDLKSHQILSAFVHFDRINCIGFANSFIISAGTDRQAIFSDFNLHELKRLKSDNLIYFCAANKDKWAYSCGFENEICTSENVKINTGNEYINSLLYRNDKLIINAYSPYILKEDNDLISNN